MGTQQSGVLDLLIADLGKDTKLLHLARETAVQILDKDPLLNQPENKLIHDQVERMKKSTINWSRIS